MIYFKKGGWEEEGEGEVKEEGEGEELNSRRSERREKEGEWGEFFIIFYVFPRKINIGK